MIRLTVIGALTKGANGHNEDLISYGKNYAYVLDGATSLIKNKFTKKYNASWYVRKFSKILNSEINSKLELPEIIKRTIIKMQREFDIINDVENYQIPSACIALVKENNDNFEFFCLGDCSILYNCKDKIFEFTSNELRMLDSKILKNMIQISKDKNIDVIDAYSYVEKQLIENRNMKNKDNGYYVLDIDENVVEHARYLKIPKDNINKIIILSDGMSSYYECMKLVDDYKDFFNKAINTKTKLLYKELKKASYKDSKLNNYPRFKIIDDISIIKIDVA